MFEFLEVFTNTSSQIAARSTATSSTFRAVTTGYFDDRDIDATTGGIVGGTAAWGAITGTLSDQTDLQSALDSKEPSDADLSAISALTGTNTIYYRSAADTWSPVTIGANLTFTGGSLAASGGGGGNVSNSGTPTSGKQPNGQVLLRFREWQQLARNHTSRAHSQRLRFSILHLLFRTI